jgi:sulfur-carrier protein adenylyltransferase/sulfurtransferase
MEEVDFLTIFIKQNVIYLHMNNYIANRYIRQVRVKDFGDLNQHKIENSKILVVGAGALGCPALMYLAAAGVGTIGVVDSDEVDGTNLHRQVMYTEADIGKPKALVASNRLREMNSCIKVETHFVRLHKDNALEILSKYDIILDCTDNFPSKFLINDACVILNKPFIIGGVLQFSGQLSVYNFNGGPTYRCLVPEEPDPLETPTCSEAGVIGMVPGIIGTMQALEALKVISGIGNNLSGRLLNFNGLSMSFTEFDIKLDVENLKIKDLKDYAYSCPDSLLEGREITRDQFFEFLNENNPPLVLAFSDDQENISVLAYEWETMPLYELPNRVGELPKDYDIVLVCEYGLKSRAALRYLVQKHNLDRVFNLKDGIASLRV